MKKSPITAVVLTHNSSQSLKRCLVSLAFCEEIIVIDDDSTDSTVEIARKQGATVHQHKLDGDFAAQRNIGMSKAQHNWLLYLDSDEELSDELKKEVISELESPRAEAYYLRRRDYWWGRELHYGELMKVRNTGLIRFVNKDAGSWKGKVHEVFETTGRVSRLEGFINHYPHPTLREFIHDVNTYSTLRAKELHTSGVHAGITQVIGYPLAKFILTYVIKLGFLDGAAGFAYAFLMSFHSYLVRTKLYQYRVFGMS